MVKNPRVLALERENKSLKAQIVTLRRRIDHLETEFKAFDAISDSRADTVEMIQQQLDRVTEAIRVVGLGDKDMW